MVCKNSEGNEYVAGISSFGYGCANDRAGFYTDVWFHMDWIEASEETKNLSEPCGAKRVQNSTDWRKIILLVQTLKYLLYDWMIKN